MTVAQATSGVGSLALIVIVGLVWWWSDIDTKAKHQHKAYLEVSDRVDILHRRERQLREDLDDQEEEHASLLKEAGPEGGAAKVSPAKITAAVDALQDRADTPHQVLTWLSWVLSPDKDRAPELTRALGGPLDGRRVHITRLVEKEGVVLLNAVALDREAADTFMTRLKASGYLTGARQMDAVQKTDPTARRGFLRFRLSATLAAPKISALAAMEDL